MNQKLKEDLPDKISLIYEFNKNSPLFAREANQQLNKGNVDKATNILFEGIKDFSNYPTAHLILSKAYAYSGEKEKAEEEIKIFSSIINDKESEEYYLQQIERILNEAETFSESRRAAFLPENFKFQDDAKDIVPEEKEEFDELANLADELSKAKVVQIEKEDDQVDLTPNSGFVFTGKPIISETLAGIYLAQGNLIDAKSLYEKLIEKEPEKAEHFKNKIAEIDKKLSAK